MAVLPQGNVEYRLCEPGRRWLTRTMVMHFIGWSMAGLMSSRLLRWPISMSWYAFLDVFRSGLAPGCMRDSPRIGYPEVDFPRLAAASVAQLARPLWDP